MKSSKILKNYKKNKINLRNYSQKGIPLTSCPVCGKDLSAISGSRDALCQNCGYKEPCCD